MNYLWHPGSNHYSAVAKSHPRDRIGVEIGDASHAEFRPSLKLLRWDGEVALSLLAQLDDIPGVQSQTLSNGVIEYRRGQWRVRFYDAPAASPEGGFEFEIEIPKKPPRNYLTFALDTTNLDYFYQPPFANVNPDGSRWQQEPDGIVYQPANVAGSYAVYHKTKGIFNNAAGMDYKAGKAFHIYRPHVTDANGDRVWADLSIDAGTLTITIDQTWLDNAAYPIIVDPTFGYETAGANSGYSDPNYTHASWFMNAVGKGTCTKISVYCSHVNGSEAMKAAIQTWLGSNTQLGSPLTNGATSAVNVSSMTNAWVDFPFPTGPTVAHNTIYWLAYNGEGGFNRVFDGVVDAGGYVAQLYSLFPAPIGGPGDHDRRYSIHCDFVTSGAKSIQIPMRSSRPPLDRPFTLNQASPQADGLVGLWSPLDRRGSGLIDMVRGQNATISGLARTPSPELGYVLKTVLGDDYARITHAPYLSPDSISVFWWANRASTSAWGKFIDKDNDVTHNSEWRCDLGSTGDTLRVLLQGSTKKGTVTLAAHNTNTWYLMGFTFSNGNLNVYQLGPGSQIVTNSDTGIGTRTTTTDDIYIANFYVTANGAAFPGSIGPVYIYNRALSAAEIWQLYAPETRWDLYLI